MGSGYKAQFDPEDTFRVPVIMFRGHPRRICAQLGCAAPAQCSEAIDWACSARRARSDGSSSSFQTRPHVSYPAQAGQHSTGTEIWAPSAAQLGEADRLPQFQCDNRCIGLLFMESVRYKALPATVEVVDNPREGSASPSEPLDVGPRSRFTQEALVVVRNTTCTIDTPDCGTWTMRRGRRQE